jgi:hypothetical protein
MCPCVSNGIPDHALSFQRMLKPSLGLWVIGTLIHILWMSSMVYDCYVGIFFICANEYLIEN